MARTLSVGLEMRASEPRAKASECKMRIQLTLSQDEKKLFKSSQVKLALRFESGFVVSSG